MFGLLEGNPASIPHHATRRATQPPELVHIDTAGLLITEDCRQGTLQCRGRRDNLCVGETGGWY